MTSLRHEDALPAARARPNQVGIVTALAAAYGLAYLVFERAGVGSQGLRDLLGNVAFMLLNIAVAVLNWLASRQPVLDAGVRKALRAMCLAAVMVFIGNCISVYYLLVLKSKPAASPADFFYLSDSLLLLVGLLMFPLSRRIRVERWKLILDAAMVVAGGAVLVWYFAIRPTHDAHGDGATLTLLTFAFPLASFLLLLGITTVLLRGPLDRNREAFGCLVAGILVSIVSDLAFDLVLLETGERSASWTDAVYMLSYLLLIASAELYWRRPVARGWTTADQEPRPQVLSPLPYMAAAAVFWLLVSDALHPWSDPVSGLVVGATVVTLVMVIRQVVAVRQNIRLLEETAARQGEARFRSLVQNSSDVIILVDAEGSVTYVSPSASRVLRYDPAALVDRSLFTLIDPDDRARAEAFFREAARAPGVSAPAEWRFQQPSGAPLHAEVIATNLLGDPIVSGIVLNTRDVSERKRFEQQLLHQAFHDPLTGLANRALFRDRVDHALKLAKRQRHTITVLFLDLDDFKKVNDSFGHGEGDKLLVLAAERFRSCARAADTVARLGGDEFAILIEDSTGPEEQQALIERLTSSMAQPFMLSGNEVFVTASVGIAAAVAGESVTEVLRNADTAMYAAKRAGKGRFESYASQMSSDVRHRLELERALRRALEKGELVLHYQPIVSLRTGAMTGVEALVRWEHPQFGHLLPQHFIPLAEETGLITRVGSWVLHEACRQVGRWRRENPALRLTVAVNLSGRELHEHNIVEDVRVALEETRIDPDALVLEITESVLMQETPMVLERLQQLKALGIQLAIDDFGTGYSSLSYLQRFPIDILKIAKPFIDKVGSGADESALARAIIGLGDTLKLRTIAEGIETPAQVAALLDLGCTMGQGYHFSTALTATQLEHALAGTFPPPQTLMVI
jgi:diguanylate cyclase (GGDEF)-like protein/PAS domain S-box-containing protein